jgi:hypothetical protein
MSEKNPSKVKCVAKCETVGGKKECSVMKPVWGTDKCVPRTMDEFEPGSCFEKKSGKAVITICCPKGKFAHGRCTVGTRALKMTL